MGVQLRIERLSRMMEERWVKKMVGMWVGRRLMDDWMGEDYTAVFQVVLWCGVVEISG